MQTFVPSPVCQRPSEDGDPIPGSIFKIQNFRSGILVILSVDQAANSPGFSADFVHMPRPSEAFSDPNSKIFEGITLSI